MERNCHSRPWTVRRAIALPLPTFSWLIPEHLLHKYSENPSSLGEMKRKGIGKTLLIAYLMNISHQNNLFFASLTRKQTEGQVSPSKDGFLQSQQRIAIWDLQPGWATCESPQHKEGTCSYREEKEGGRHSEQEAVSESSQERRDFLLLTGLCCHLGPLSWSPTLFNSGFSILTFL